MRAGPGSDLEISLKAASDDFGALVTLAGPETRAVLEKARAMIRALHSDVTEIIWLRQRIVSFGFGPRKMTDHYAYLQLNARHVNLGFYHADRLDDPGALLQGSGLKLRHVKIIDLEELDRESVRVLLHGAMEERKATLASNCRGGERAAP